MLMPVGAQRVDLWNPNRNQSLLSACVGDAGMSLSGAGFRSEILDPDSADTVVDLDPDFVFRVAPWTTFRVFR